MRFTPTALEDCLVVDLEPHEDERGLLARIHCADEVSAAGLDGHVEQINLVHNQRAGTVRGLHYQLPPHGETKIVRCVRGALVDVAVDVREHSPTFLEHVTIELSETNRRALAVPAGFAHGYQTLVDDVEVLYTSSHPYVPAAERGLRHDDPRLGLHWPRPVSAISDKDRAWPAIGHEWSSGIH